MSPGISCLAGGDPNLCLPHRKERTMSRSSIAARVAATLALLLGALLAVPVPAQAHSTSEYVSLWTPIVGSSRWATTAGTQPSGHHIVYSNWGYLNDWSVDIFAPPGSRVVSPFGSKASNGQPTRVTVVGVRSGCASGAIADGGYRITLELQNAATGVVLSRADLMHVNSPQVGVGAVVGPWTTLGYTARFRSSSCYQVNNDAGVHVHAEFVDAHRYSCYVNRGNGAAINENTVIGRAAAHRDGRRAVC
jgi:hypothetical protein